MKNDYDVIIVGDGIVGHTMSLYLNKYEISSCIISNYKTNSKDSFNNLRFSALNHHSREILQSISAWDEAVLKPTVFKKIVVEDANSYGKFCIKSSHLSKKELGYINAF